MQLERFDSSGGDNLRFNLLIWGRDASPADIDDIKEEYEKWGQQVLVGLAKEYGSVADVILPPLRAFLDAAVGPGIYELRNSSLVASAPGCSRQVPHTDVTLHCLDAAREIPKSIKLTTVQRALKNKRMAWRNATSPPLSILVAVLEHTHLWVWKGSDQDVWYFLCGERPPGPRGEKPFCGQRLRLERGQAAIFSGAFVHAGSELADTAAGPHVRFHVYADVVCTDKDTKHPLARKFNATGLVADYDGGNAGEAARFFVFGEHSNA